MLLLLLFQELDAARAACAEGDVLLQEAEARLAAVQTAAAAKQEQALQVCLDVCVSVRAHVPCVCLHVRAHERGERQPMLVCFGAFHLHSNVLLQFTLLLGRCPCSHTATICMFMCVVAYMRVCVCLCLSCTGGC